MEIAALEHEIVFINGGQRGLQVCLKPGAALDVLRADSALIMA